MIIVPSGKDLKAARSYLDWTQADVAEKSGISVQSVNLIEKGKQKPSDDLAKTFAKIFYNENIIFHNEGGFKVNDSPIKILTGDDCYLQVQEDIIKTMMFNEIGEVLYFGSDERKSSEEVIKNEIKMYKLRITSRALVRKGDDYFMGELENYRLVESKYFTGDITIVYGTKTAFSLSFGKNQKIVLINDKELSSSFRAQFDNLWQNGIKPKKSTAPHTYKELAGKIDTYLNEK